ncbi:hypothetical protein JVU11DRAFT_4661 [Chiua virens]|nr:hypothetical protein JVU11DRAFT_4661 [Chiua virens]
MQAPQEMEKTTDNGEESTLVEEPTLVDLDTPQKMVEQPASTPNSASNARRITRSQTTGRPTVRWGKYSKDDDSEDEQRSQQKGPETLKRTFDARAVDEETDEDPDHDPASQPAKIPRTEPVPLLPTSSSMTVVSDVEQSPVVEDPPVTTPRMSPPAGEYTFLDASSSSFTAERRGPRIRTAPPVPVPNLTKKSRGRRVPTAVDTAPESENVEGKKGRVYVCKVQDCGKCFSRGEHLKRHVRSIHTHEKPFKCPHPSCDKRFNRNDNLLQHLRVHKGDNSSQTSVDSTAGPAGDEPTAEESSSTPQRALKGNGSRRASRPIRKTKSAASTPPIPVARLAASRIPGRSLPPPLPRTYSMPPLSSIASSYHTPAGSGFLSNTNIAVSSLRTAIDESDGEVETDTDIEARGGHDIRSLYSFSRDLGKQSLRDSAYAVREDVQADQMNGEVASQNSADGAREAQGAIEGDIQAKSEGLGPSPEPGTSPVEEVGERPIDIPSVASTPPPSAVSV